MVEYFQFTKMISTSIIRGVHAVGFAVITLGSVIFLIKALPGPRSLIIVAILIIGNLVWRLICETWILFFRIHESLVSIEDNTSGK